MYDVGKITRELQSAFRLFGPATKSHDGVVKLELADKEGTDKNLATAANLRLLVDELEQLTQQIIDKRDELEMNMATIGAVILFGPGSLLVTQEEALASWDLDMTRWRGRLGAYRDAVDAAPSEDRATVLWGVTAPLLLGFYGGEASKLPQQPLDAATPFALANQLNVVDEWRAERWKLFIKDLKDGLKQVVDTGVDLITLAAIAAGVVVAVTILNNLPGRR